MAHVAKQVKVAQEAQVANVAQEKEEQEGEEEEERRGGEEELLFYNHNKNTEKSCTELALPASSGTSHLLLIGLTTT